MAGPRQTTRRTRAAHAITSQAVAAVSRLAAIYVARIRVRLEAREQKRETATEREERGDGLSVPRVRQREARPEREYGDRNGVVRVKEQG